MGDWVGPPLDLGRVHAVMLRRERVRQRESSYRFVYELTLVLEGEEQVLLADHGDLSRMQEEAAVLVRWLSVPYWDESTPRGTRRVWGR